MATPLSALPASNPVDGNRLARGAAVGVAEKDGIASLEPATMNRPRTAASDLREASTAAASSAAEGGVAAEASPATRPCMAEEADEDEAAGREDHEAGHGAAAAAGAGKVTNGGPRGRAGQPLPLG
jgi:hypothetical protein